MNLFKLVARWPQNVAHPHTAGNIKTNSLCCGMSIEGKGHRKGERGRNTSLLFLEQHFPIYSSVSVSDPVVFRKRQQ